MKKRTSFTDLPDTTELEKIIEKEAKRPVAVGKETIHYALFDAGIAWLNALSLPTEIFTHLLSWQEVITEGVKLQEEVVRKTLRKENDMSFTLITEHITSYLGEEDEPENADLIFVFGGNTIGRIQKGVDLWKRGFAPIIFITGSRPHYKNVGNEAEEFRDYAILHGVPAEKIFVETQAITVADNVRRGLNLLDELHLAYKRMIIVDPWYMQRRCFAMMMKHIPEDYHLYRVNSPVDPNGSFQQDNWWKNEEGIKAVFNEFVKLKTSESLNSS